MLLTLSVISDSVGGRAFYIWPRARTRFECCVTPAAGRNFPALDAHHSQARASG
jgi:hypothetical protein